MTSHHLQLPRLCNSGHTSMEKKLLYYMAMRPTHRFELRELDSTQLSPEDLPTLEGDYVFIPLFEASLRIFMFEHKADRIRAMMAFAKIDKKLKPAKVRKPRVRKPKANRPPRKRSPRSRK